MAEQQGYSQIPGADIDCNFEINNSDSEDGEEGQWLPQRSSTPSSMGEERTRLRSRSPDGEGNAVKSDSKRKLQKCMCIFATIFFVLLLAAAIVILVVLLIVVGQQPAKVRTNCGAVEGKYDPVNKVFIFKGIPFAAPPVGRLRWKAPEPVKNSSCWKGVYKANKFKSMCVQYDAVDGVKGSEDCLYLNIYTPMVDPSTPLPVMVYIHGGYLQWGDGHTPGYAPDERITSSMQVVFVSIQYRLNAFGFLVSEALPGRNGNYGFLDQVEALRWVKENIHGFGGDPNKVTIFGQSSGGTSVWALMMSPMARGLFSRAWMLSASPVYNKTTEDAAIDNAFFLKDPDIKASCKNNVTESCLLQMSPDKIVKAIYPKWNIVKDSMNLPEKNYFEPALCVVDGEHGGFMPAAPFEMWKKEGWRGKYSDVPVIIGTTAQEIDIDPAPGESLKSWTKADLDNYVRAYLDGFGGNISNQSLALYPLGDKDPEYVFTSMTSDLRMNCGNDLMAKKAAVALSSPVYRYVVTSAPSRPAYPFGFQFGSLYAFHSWDSFAFFWGFDLIFKKGHSQSDAQFGEMIQQEILHFVQEGHPKDPSWQAYPNTTALLDSKLTVTDAYHEEQCNFWLRNGFFSYAWIN